MGGAGRGQTCVGGRTIRLGIEDEAAAGPVLRPNQMLWPLCSPQSQSPCRCVGSASFAMCLMIGD
ncbi:hypothetical protein E2C01_084934 [Portunus trituberculatus]|uniref:Uncharacterized protein n=1 Tax=Portunus trituberculatus TaxID=210409 RepID=A0A5B7JAL2_PORTR|nr:hypothetical protein [Portunus trituberculatus]